MARVFSYRRFSDIKQRTNTSLSRQLKMAMDYCTTHGHELDQTLHLTDTSVSAFHGKNRDEGALGEFLQAIKDGVVKCGDILAIESFDRLSREGWWETASLCQKIASAGVSIVVLKSGQVYDKAMLDSLQGGITLVVEASLAAEESKQKSRRIRSAWVDRKASAIEHGTKIGELVPKWLDIPRKIKGVADNRKVTINEERKAVVLRIVDAYLSGVGKQKIAMDLNRDGVKTFTDHQVGRKKKSQWWEGTIVKLLKSESLTGSYQGRSDFYPAIIDTNTWHDIRAMEANSHKRMMPKHNALANPLSGLGTCVRCGSIMTRICTTIGKKKYYRLTCMARKSGKVMHTRYSIDWPKAMALVMKHASAIIEEAPLPDHVGEDELQRLNDEMIAVQQQIDNFMNAIGQGLGNGLVIERCNGLQAHQKVLGAQLTKAQEEVESMAPASLKRRRQELVNLLASDPATIDPAELNAKLKLCFSRIVFNVDGSIHQWVFVDGSTIDGNDPVEVGAELAEIADNRLVRG